MLLLRVSQFCFSCLCISPLVADESHHLSGAGRDPGLDALTFTGTQAWAAKYLDRTNDETRYFPADWRKKFSLPVPPANSSPRTMAELAYLEPLTRERDAHAKQIRSEVMVTNYRWNGLSYETLTRSKKYARTGKLLRAAYHDLAVAVFTFKHRFNRVRPSILGKQMGKDFGNLIDIPAHPAYPSGHATGAFTMAYLLQELDPKNARVYLKDALRIARNREIAGLHYPSDTEAGRLLARQIADALLANPRFQTLLKSARSEW